MSKLLLPDLTEFGFKLGKILRNIASIVNNGLYPSSNFAQFDTTGTTPGIANTEFSVAHNLHRGGVEFIYWLDGPGTLYEDPAGTAWTNDTIYLKCTDASRGYRIIVR